MAMTKRLWLWIVVLAVLSVVLVTSTDLFAQDAPKAGGFDRKAMLANIGYGVILPYHEQMVEKMAALEAAVSAFSDWPSQPNLDAVQAAWKEASTAWEHCRLFNFRRVMAYHSAINKTPPNSEFIEEFIAGDEMLDEAFINSKGSTAKGLPAVEYLIFAVDGDDTQHLIRFSGDAAGKRRLQYLVALSQHLTTSAETLYNIWSLEGEAFVDTIVNADQDGGDLQGSINMLVNLIIPSLDRILQGTFATSGVSGPGDDRRLSLTEGKLSGYALQQITAQIESMRAVFAGSGDVPPPAGLNAYLDFLGSQYYTGASLPETVITQFDDAIDKVAMIQRAIDGDSSVAGDIVTQAYRSIKTLLTTMRIDVASQLGVTITFSDADGD